MVTPLVAPQRRGPSTDGRPVRSVRNHSLHRPVLAYCAVVRTGLIAVGVAAACLIAAWSLLILLARRLPPGILRDLAAFIPDCVTTVRRLRKDPRVPRRAKLAVAIAGLWVISPIDLIPEFLPIIGPLDDIVVIALALRYAARQVPREVLLGAWPGEPRLLLRLLGAAGT